MEIKHKTSFDGVSQGPQFMFQTQQYDYLSNLRVESMKETTIVPEKPIQEFKLLLESAKQQNNLFIYNFIKTPPNIRLGKLSIPPKSHSQFHNYNKILQYSKKKRNIEQFQKQSPMKSSYYIKKRSHTLKEFVEQKRTKMLTQVDKFYKEDQQVESLLKNQKSKYHIFNETLLLQRYNFIKKQENKYPQNVKILQKFKDENPKHFRILQKFKDEKQQSRRKYIYNQKSHQYYKNAMKAQKNELSNKQFENNLVISMLMSKQSLQLSQGNKQEQIMSNKINQLIHRMFLKYANSDSEDIKKMYRYINKENIIKLLNDFKLQYKSDPHIVRIINCEEITQFTFIEIIHLISKAQGCNLQPFVQQNILKYTEFYTPPQLVKQQPQNLFSENSKGFIVKQLRLKRIKQKLELIYQKLTKKRMNGIGADKDNMFQRQRYYNFDQLVQILFLMKIYPFMVNKSRLRFYYLYIQQAQTGVKIQHIIDIYVWIALSKQGDINTNIKEIIRIVTKFYKNNMT